MGNGRNRSWEQSEQTVRSWGQNWIDCDIVLAPFGLGILISCIFSESLEPPQLFRENREATSKALSLRPLRT